MLFEMMTRTPASMVFSALVCTCPAVTWQHLWSPASHNSSLFVTPNYPVLSDTGSKMMVNTYRTFKEFQGNSEGNRTADMGAAKLTALREM